MYMYVKNYHKCTSILSNITIIASGNIILRIIMNYLESETVMNQIKTKKIYRIVSILIILINLCFPYYDAYAKKNVNVVVSEEKQTDSDAIEEVQTAMKGMLAPTYKEVLLGHAEVRQTIRVPNVGTIAGCYVRSGKIARHAQIRIVRDGIVIFEDSISSLKRFKDDAREVAEGYECGVGLDKFNDIKEGDVLEAFIMEEVKK